MPDLITNSHVYIATPPLYLVKRGKEERAGQMKNAQRQSVWVKQSGSVRVQRYKGLERWMPNSFGIPRWILQSVFYVRSH